MMYNSRMAKETLYLILGYIACMNLFAFVLFGTDKRRALKKAWRIPEKALLMSAFLSGAYGAYAGMKMFRHKTRHWYFVIGMPAILLAQVLILALAALKLGAFG